MWAEAQLDKSRLKEENITKLDFPSFMGGKTEIHLARSAAEGSQSPLPDINNRNTDLSPSVAESKKSVHDLNSVQNDLNSLPTEKTLVAQDFSTGPDSFLAQQLAFASKRSRSQLKSYIAHRAEEMYVYRSLPLGQDRRRNRYWQFVASASSNDPGSGRVFVELHDGNWRLIDTEEAFDALLMSLDTRGIRESHLRLMLQKIETSFRSVQSSSITGRGVSIVKCETDETSPDSRANFDSPGSTVCGLNSDSDLVETSSSFRIELGRNETEKKAALRRYQDFQKWMLEECKNSSTLRAMKCGKMRCRQRLEICDFCLGLYSLEDSHCFSCHQTFSNSGNDLSRHAIQCKERSKSDFVDTSFPFGIRLLKALLALIEVSVPQEALQSFWMGDRGKTWGVKLNASSSSEQLLQILTLFESVIKRDFLSSNYSTTEELSGSCNQSGTSLHNNSDPASVPVLPWIPHAAVALRLFDLDASIAYVPEEKTEPIEDKDRELGEYIKLPTRFAPSRNDKEIELTELDYNVHVKEENRSQLKSSRNNYKRGRGAREQGRSKKLQRRVNGSKPGASRRNAMVNDNVIEGLRQPGRKALKQGGLRGRRTVRKRRTGNKKVEETLPVHMPDIPSSPESGGESPRILAEEWDDDNVNATPMKDDDNIVGEEDAMESDDNAQEEEYEQENWEVGYNGVSNTWNEGRMMEASDEDVDAYDEDDNGIEGVGDGESEGDVDVSEESDDMPNRIENDQGSDSEVSDDYSD